jgi:hypothetical protein
MEPDLDIYGGWMEPDLDIHQTPKGQNHHKQNHPPKRTRSRHTSNPEQTKEFRENSKKMQYKAAT